MDSTVSLISPAATASRLGLALDIDGVFLKGKRVIPGTPAALQTLNRNRVPYVFVTNGGGITEQAKAEQLTNLLGTKITKDMVLLSHTPYRSLVKQYATRRVLVLGSPGCEEVAKSYGFLHPVTCKQFAKAEAEAEAEGQEGWDEPCAAAFVLGDPLDWALEIQVLTDVLRPVKGAGEEPAAGAGAGAGAAGGGDKEVGWGYLESSSPHPYRQRVPLYCSNADLVYTNEHKFPRFTQVCAACACVCV